MAIQLPTLPYGLNGLAPVISEETMQYHYGRHHQTYINNLNKLIAGTMFDGMNLDEIVMVSNGLDQGIFNNAAQAWNHTFFWMSLSRKGGGKPMGELLSRIEEQWGSFEAFREAFVTQAGGNFGSGWTWLVMTPEKTLAIRNTSNAQTVLCSDDVPLLVVDVWEHAYYIDYRNNRVAFVNALFDQLLDWEFAAKNFYLAK